MTDIQKGSGIVGGADTPVARIRINAKQTSKGAWYLDITVETSENDPPSGLLLLTIEETRAKLLKAGMSLVDSE